MQLGNSCYTITFGHKAFYKNLCIVTHFKILLFHLQEDRSTGYTGTRHLDLYMAGADSESVRD